MQDQQIVISGDHLEILAEFTAAEPREPVYADTPKWLERSPAALRAARSVIGEKRLYRHQAKALELAGAGQDTVISTSTASGKSLVFQLLTIHRLAGNPAATAMVLYPLKALARDQLRTWRRMAQATGWNESAVAIVDGDIRLRDRAGILDRARIVLTNPDTLDAWFLKNAARAGRPSCPRHHTGMELKRGERQGRRYAFYGCPHYPQCQETLNELPVWHGRHTVYADANQASRRFIRRLDTLIIDELHSYDKVMGANLKILLARIERKRAEMDPRAKPVRLLAASATIADPAKHANRVTGRPFAEVNEEDDGAPKRRLSIIHARLPQRLEYGEYNQQYALAIRDILQANPEAKAIAFHDRRQGAEEIARAIEPAADTIEELRIIDDSELCAAYRANINYRERIEERLHEGGLPCVVSTSALEMGIEIPNLNLGFQTGNPQTLASLRQRAGRVGRDRQGCFVVITSNHVEQDSPGEMPRSTLESWYHSRLPEPHTYDGNPTLKGINALKIAAEADSGDDSGGQWPQDLSRLVSMAQSQSYNAPEFDFLPEQDPSTGALDPHTSLSFRTSERIKIPLRRFNQDETQADTKINEQGISAAFQESYPKGSYIHQKQSYVIDRWENCKTGNLADATIIAVQTSNPPKNRPMRQRRCRIEDSPQTRKYATPSALATYGPATLEDRITGVKNMDKEETEILYRDMNPPHPEIVHRSKTTATTLDINYPWFREDHELRREIARELKRIINNQEEIAPEELGEDPEEQATVFDTIPGGMTMTRNLFHNLIRQCAENPPPRSGGKPEIRLWLKELEDSWQRDGTEPPPPDTGV